MPITLTVTQTRIRPYLEYSGSPAIDYADANISLSENRIAEAKYLILDITSNTTLANLQFWVNPALFIAKAASLPFSGIPPTFYSYIVPASPSAGLYTMAYQSPSNINPLTGQNYTVEFEYITSLTFRLWILFYNTCDSEGFTDPTVVNNHSRFFKDAVSNPNELTEAGTNIYSSSTIDLRVYIYARHVIATGLFGSLDHNPGYGYKAGFYGKNAQGAAPYFTNPTWVLERLSTPVSSFSPVLDTDITFTCDSAVAPSAMVLRVIREDKIDDTVDFISNYEMESSEIVTGGATVGKIKAPFVGPTLVGGTTYSWTFSIDSSLVNYGENYRMIAIVYYYNYPVAVKVNTFISDSIPVNADQPYDGNGFTFTGRIADTLYQYAGNFLTCSIEERMFSKLKMSFSANKWKNDILARLGLTVANDPTRYLTKVEFTIKSPETMVTGFSNPFGEIYDYRVLTRTTRGGGAPRYIGSGISMDTSVTDEYTFIADWRNRYESDQANYASLINGVLYYPGGSNQNWATGSLAFPPHLELEWKFTFYYDDYITPFTDYIVYTQKMVVRDYVADTILKITAQNNPFDSKDFWCSGEYMCLQGEIVDSVLINPTDNYFLITNIDPLPGNIATIKEAEVFVPYQTTLSQLTTAEIYDQEMIYGSSTALMGKFCVDETLLPLGDYKITVLAKRS